MRDKIFIRARLIVFLSAVFLLAFFLMLAIQSGKIRRLTAQVAAVETEVLDVYARTEALERQLAFTATDEYVAQEARRRFGYLSDGEIRFVLEGTTPFVQ